MKKLSLLCILAILCTGLLSCDDAIVVNPGNTDKSSSASTTTTASVSRDDTGITSSADSTEANPVMSEPTVEKPDILYCSNEPFDCRSGYTMNGVTGYLEYFEEKNQPYTICMVTAKEIDYSLIGEDKLSSIPITVSIDKIFNQNSYSYLNEGDIVTVDQPQCAWKKIGDAFEVYYYIGGLAIAEVGKSYLAIVSDPSYLGSYLPDFISEYPLKISAISVPLPDKNEISDEYFKEQYKKLGADYNIADYFGPESLKKWFYPYIEAE